MKNKLQKHLKENEELRAKLVVLEKQQAEKAKNLNQREVHFKTLLKKRDEEKKELDKKISLLNKNIEVHAKSETELKNSNTLLAIDLQKANEALDAHIKKIKSECESKLVEFRKECQLEKEKCNNEVVECRKKFESEKEQLTKEHERNINHLVTQQSKSTETHNLTMEALKCDNKDKHAIIFNLKKRIVDLEETNKMSEQELQRVTDLENSTTLVRFEDELKEFNERNRRLAKLNDSLRASLIDTEKNCREENEKIKQEAKFEKYEFEHCLNKSEKVFNKFI